MKYVAITQKTAEWLLSRSAVRSALHQVIGDAANLSKLRDAEISEGPLRIAGSSDQKVVAIWNADYSSGTGDEPWGFVKIASPLGIFDHQEISDLVFERCLYVINQRLQGLRVEFIHRTLPSGAHTCLAARGEEGRQLSIAYVDGSVGESGTRMRSVLCVGPSRNKEAIEAAALRESRDLGPLCTLANRIMSPSSRRPILDETFFSDLKEELAPEWSRAAAAEPIPIDTKTEPVLPREVYRTASWSYDQWMAKNSPLSPIQRRIIETGAIKRHPIRVTGPGGSGKTLLMQLMCISLLREAAEKDEPLSVLYIAHNAQMAEKSKERFRVLGADCFFADVSQRVSVTTLSAFGREYLELPEVVVIDKDAEKSKEFQLDEVRDAIKYVFGCDGDCESALLRAVRNDESLFDIFSRLVMVEISIAIKAHGLAEFRKRYVESETSLTRFHGVLNAAERNFVFSVFERYHSVVFEQHEVLDADDIAISLLLRLRTPIRQLKRKVEGYDYVFVDETQLFNENERRIFPLLTKGIGPNVPIALALDQAQEPYGQTSAGLGLLGFKDIEDEVLPSAHRSTREIIDLAFFVIQKTTDLFSNEFPEFVREEDAIGEQGQLAVKPHLKRCGAEEPFGEFIRRQVWELKKANVRQIAIVCHNDAYWRDIEQALKGDHDMPLAVLLQRGLLLDQDQPVVVLTRPDYVGGQEFDAVFAVGLEQGVFPPRVIDNPPLAAALEQQAYREMYLTFTRARYRIIIPLSHNGAPNSTVQQAVSAGLVSAD